MTETARYMVRYFNGDNVISEDPYDDLEEACNIASCFDVGDEESCCEDFEDPEEEEDFSDWDSGHDYYVEVRDMIDNVIMFWQNEDGDRGSDYKGDGEAKKIIDEALQY